MYCKKCFRENRSGVSICSDCWNILEEVSLVEKEMRIQDFTNFFLENYRVLDTGEAIGITKISIEKGIVHYNFWKPRFQWKYFFLNLINPINTLLYIGSLFQNENWKVKFHTVGFPLEVRDSAGRHQDEVLDQYLHCSEEYLLFRLKNENLFKRKNFFLSKISRVQWVYIALVLLILMIVLTSK